jgi:hypothetical protein
MFREALIPQLESRFADRALRVLTEGRTIAVIPAASEAVGDLTFLDDGDEVTLVLGALTHVHFHAHDDSLSRQEAAQRIAQEAADFIQAVLDERLLLWVSPNGSAGFYEAPPAPVPLYVHADDLIYAWSGPRENPRVRAD